MPIEESNQSTEYEIFRANAMAEKERASQEKLDRVLSYTKQNLVLYLSKTDLNRLCEYITEYYLSDTLPKVEQIKVNYQLKPLTSCSLVGISARHSANHAYRLLHL